jgi:hypothetical protein
LGLSRMEAKKRITGGTTSDESATCTHGLGGPCYGHEQSDRLFL